MPQSARPPDLDAQGQPVGGSTRPPDLDADGRPAQGSAANFAMHVTPTSDEQWAAMTPAERARQMLKWGGNVIAGMTGMGDAGRQAVENPGSTLASGAVPVGLGAAATSTLPYIAPAARATAAALEHPLVSSGVGAAAGYVQGGPTGAVIGALTGGTMGPRVGRDLKKVANRFDPPARRPNVDTVASRRMIDGMSEPTTVRSAPVVEPPVAPPVAAAPPAAPVETPPPPAAPHTSPATTSARPPSVPGMSPQRIQNELGLTARRTGATLSKAEYAAAGELVAQGKSPAEAIARTIGARPAAPTKIRLSQEEASIYAKLRKSGKTHAEAAEAIEVQRALAKALGTQSTRAMRARVDDRNDTGQWSTPTGFFPPRK